MNATHAQKLEIALEDGTLVSALLIRPPQVRACFVFAHGAGAGMGHPFMEAVASGLAERGVASLRYQFPYMEKDRDGRTHPWWRRPRSPRGSE